LDLQAKQWPTPNVPNGGRSVAHTEQIGQTLYHEGKKVQLGLEAAVKRWPTPVASDNANRTTKNAPSHGNWHGGTLAGMAGNWPTPTARAGQHPGHQGRSGTPNLDTVIQNWGTPTVQDAGSRTYQYPSANKDERTLTLLGQAVLWPATDPFLLGQMNSKTGEKYSTTTRKLNPLFVCWLMGIPIGWTSFDYAATESYLSWRQKHSEALQGIS
jgi:hypothetical protein